MRPRQRVGRGASSLLCAVLTAAGPTVRAAGPPGIVVEAIGPGSAAAVAGIETGDILTSWESTTTAAGERGGDLSSPFDLTEVEVEQAPRGPVRILGRRGGRDVAFTLGPADWKIEARPPMTHDSLARYEEGKALLATPDAADGSRRWRELAKAAQEANDRRLACWLLLSLGEARARSKAWAEADHAYAAALDAAAAPRDRAAVHAAHARSLEARREYAKAGEAYRLALQALETTAPESLAAAASLHGLGRQAWLREEVDEAESFYRRALAVGERLAPDSRPVASALQGLANVVDLRGDTLAAQVAAERAAGIRRRLVPDSLEMASVLNLLGVLSTKRGDLAGAESQLQRSVQIRRKHAVNGDDLTIARYLHNLANATRDPDRLRDLLQEALAISERLAPDGVERAGHLTSLGLVAQAAGDLEAAERHLRQAIEVYQKLNPRSFHLALAWNNLAELELARGRPDEAYRLASQALGIAEAVGPDGTLTANILETRAAVLADRGEVAAAQAAYRRARAIYRHAGAIGLEALSLGHIARLALQSGNGDQATDLYLQALDRLEQRGGMSSGPPESRIAYGERFDDLYSRAITLLVDRARGAEAFQVLERSRARSFLALLAERDLVDASVPADLEQRRRRVDAEYDRVQSGLTAPVAAEVRVALERRLRESGAEQQQIRDEIRRSSPRFSALRYPQPLDVGQAEASLDPGTVLLSYAVGAERTHLFVIRRGESAPGAFSIPIGRRALEERVRAFRDRIRQATPEEALAAEAAALYDLLVGPAQAQVGAAERVLVSPDGPLHTLPFGALKRAGRYLVEGKPLHTVLSATVYAELRRQGPPPAAASRVVVFGDPRYSERTAASEAVADPVLRDVLRTGWNLAPLPASRREAESIARLYPGEARVYAGREATEERAKSESARARYLHFACHGLLDERFPLNSALALSIPDDVPDGGDNGFLQAWEVFERVRLEADLVTLSACDSGLGKEMGGEGLVGLTRAFQYAGARSVVASLWSVPDRSTPDLMERFYRGLRRGLPKDEALRQAQIALIHGRRRRSHPLRWAGFQLFGDWK